MIILSTLHHQHDVCQILPPKKQPITAEKITMWGCVVRSVSLPLTSDQSQQSELPHQCRTLSQRISCFCRELHCPIGCTKITGSLQISTKKIELRYITYEDHISLSIGRNTQPTIISHLHNTTTITCQHLPTPRTLINPFSTGNRLARRGLYIHFIRSFKNRPRRSVSKRRRCRYAPRGPHQRNSNLEMSLNLSLMIQKQSQKKKKKDSGFNVIHGDAVK